MNRTLILLLGLTAKFFATVTFAHPGSGIVVDAHKNVFFQDAVARTIWRIHPDGKVSAHSDKLGGHWMTDDAEDRFAKTSTALVLRLTSTNGAPALIVAEGGAPIAVTPRGPLYYGLDISNAEKVAVGITRLGVDGKTATFAPALAQMIENLGITGLATSADGTIYAACLTDLIKLNPDGTFTKVASCALLPNCDTDAPTPFLRGLDVDTNGVVYAAATGCRQVIKISPTGKVETILKAESPWSPTGVAVRDGTVYVLEFTHANGAAIEGWLPRVRKLTPDGNVTTLTTITDAQQRAQPNRMIVR